MFLSGQLSCLHRSRKCCLVDKRSPRGGEAETMQSPVYGAPVEPAEPASFDGLVNMSKTEILRGIIGEKLSAAAREIFAVLERTVSDYEDELERQRRQLELLQPEIKVEVPDEQTLFPVCEGGGGGGAADEEEEKYELSVRNIRTICYPEDQQEEECEPPAGGAAQDQQPDPPGLTDLVQLRIRILEDCELEVLSVAVFQKYPLHELQCPRSLQEDDFLRLLRSTFPQLAADRPFDFFITDRRRRLQPLRVRTLTPEEVYRTIRTSGNSALYIRLQQSKKRKRAAAPVEEAAPVEAESSHPDSRRQSSPWISDTHVELRVRVLDDSNITFISPNVFSKYPFRDVKCPRSLRGAEFLDLLRSTFPQLPPDQPLTLSMCQRQKLKPLRAKRLTPEEILRTRKSTGRPVVFVQVKSAEKLQADQSVETEDAAESPPSPPPARPPLEAASSLSDRKKRGRPRSSLVHLRLRILDSSVNMLPIMFHRYRLHELQCPRNLKEEDFLRLLRSTFPQLAADRPFDVFILDRRTTRKLKPLPVQSLTPDEISRNIRNSRNAGSSILYICLQKSGRAEDALRTREQEVKPELPGAAPALHSCKVCAVPRSSMNMLIKHAWIHVTEQGRLCGVCGLRSASAEELRRHLQTHQKTHRCHVCGKSFLSVTGLKGHEAQHKAERPYQCKTCHKSFTAEQVLKNHQWVHTPDKPYKCDVCAKSFLSAARLKKHQLKHNKPFSCSLCGWGCSSERKLHHHQKRHRNEQQYACSKCGKLFGSVAHLQVHLRVHTGEKPYSCSICGMAFSQKHCVKRHQATHRTPPVSTGDTEGTDT